MKQEEKQAALELVRMWGEYHYGRDGKSAGPRHYSKTMPSGDLELEWQRDLRVAAQVVDRALGYFETFQRARVSRLLKWVGYLGEPIESFHLVYPVAARLPHRRPARESK